MNIQKHLFELQDVKYARFQSKLTPNIKEGKIIGVRVPQLRAFAKTIFNSPECSEFIEDLPHKYYDENILHSILLSEIKNYDECIKAVDAFLPYVDNWAVCDIMSPKVFKKNKDKIIFKIKEWISSEKTYTIRFGLKALMSLFLDKDFKTKYLEIASNVHSDEYYVNMMIAWFFATALAKQWESAIIYIENGKLDRWVNNKTIQKACESYRITDEQKKHLQKFKK
ncbi:MAG: DNA alkylation repair protein [Clostridia bacterium]|nr:DNA alkylation repair protein [Clostridia bacterium]